jgi:glutathione synthase/RimK-type ligase-like ATP-grasp enzyme
VGSTEVTGGSAALGFAVPATVVTTDPDEVLGFRTRHGRVIYKS